MSFHVYYDKLDVISVTMQCGHFFIDYMSLQFGYIVSSYLTGALHRYNHFKLSHHISLLALVYHQLWSLPFHCFFHPSCCSHPYLRIIMEFAFPLYLRNRCIHLHCPGQVGGTPFRRTSFGPSPFTKYPPGRLVRP